MYLLWMLKLIQKNLSITDEIRYLCALYMQCIDAAYFG